MTPEQRAEWRALADRYADVEFPTESGLWRWYEGAGPATVLALLDALDAAEAEVERLTEKAARLQEIVATRPPLDYRVAEARLARLSPDDEALVEAVARDVIAEWQRVEPDHAISKYPASYVATFVDLARAAVAAVAREVNG
jgi:hypothetical protein